MIDLEQIRGSENLAPKDSPTFTGSPSAPTPGQNEQNNCRVATVGFLREALRSCKGIPFVYRNLTGTAAKTTSPYYCARWDVTDSSVTEYFDGMVVCVIVPVAGNGDYGTALQINSLGYKPIVCNVNTGISTRYSVGSVVWVVYNSTQKATLYVNSSSSSTITGCWQVMDYNSDNNTIGYNIRTNTTTRPVIGNCYRYRICFSNADDTKWVAANHSTSTSTTSAKTVATEKINPFGRIIYYGSTTNRTDGQTLSTSYQWSQRCEVSLGYSFNRTGTDLTLTYPAPVYVKCTPQDDGSAIIDPDTPIVQALPSTNDGKIYIYLGQTYSATAIDLTLEHPVYYHDGTKICLYDGNKQVQADWGQNDDNADDFIKNQPHALKDSAIIHALADGTVIENVVRDYDGNWYNGVVMNNQIWLKESLRVTHNPAGDSISYLHVNGDSSNDEVYGLLYDWDTTMNGSDDSNLNPSGVQGIAPNGWHIPSTSEWNAFQTYIGQQNQYILDNNSTYIAKALASKIGWIEDDRFDYAPGNDLSANDATHFSAMPGLNDDIGNSCSLWSTTKNIYSPTDAREGVFIMVNSKTVLNASIDMTEYMSVRCIMNMSASDWFAANRSRLYLKNTSNGFVWSQLSEVAESGSYNDLKDKPTIPSGGGGLTNYDFTEISTPTISSGATTITFAANQRNSIELSTNADLSIALISNNKADNYIWITNSHSTDDIDITFSSISFGATTINDIIGTDSIPTIAHGETLEIGVYVTNSKARITSRIL